MASTVIEQVPEAERANQAVRALLDRYEHNWPAMAREVFDVKLDKAQEAILQSVHDNRRTAVRSGHARGKDFIAAVASLCFLYTRIPCKVINTGPTGRQVKSIMMSEIGSILCRSKLPLGGTFQSMGIKMPHPGWFLEGFKAGDKDTEAWTGYHSPNVLVVVTEASGLDDSAFNAIEGLLTGNSRLLIVGNPNQTVGHFYRAFQSGSPYTTFTLSCLDAPNVLAHRCLISGQVDWEWVNGRVQDKAWASPIPDAVADPLQNDFFWEGHWHRPSPLFLSRVQGQFPKDDGYSVFPPEWVEAAMERHASYLATDGGYGAQGYPLRLGVDVAGMGTDSNCMCFRRGNIVTHLNITATQGQDTMSRDVAGLLLEHDDAAFVDTIGEGAGVYSRLLMDLKANVVSVKFSESAVSAPDLVSSEYEFANMRAYCYWQMRNALDPSVGINLSLPYDEGLLEELGAIHWKWRNGKIIVEPKDVIRAAIGHSPDKADAIALTFYPYDEAGASAVGGGWDVSPG